MPVFNAEEYLNEAIESVLKQTYKDFELILINDASTDGSKKICEEYENKDSRVILLENSTNSHGPGPTRNVGLNYATGQYIYFMDSDDWIEEKLLEVAVNYIMKTSADVVQFGVKYESGKNTEPCLYCLEKAGVLYKTDIQNNFFSFWNSKNCYLWIHLFRNETVKNIRFENIINGEDVSYVMDALSRANTIAYIPEVFYHYRHLEGSTCHRWIPNIIECLEIQWEHTVNFLDSLGEEQNPMFYAEAAYFDYVWALYQLCLKYCPLSYREKKRKLMDMRNQLEFENYRKIYPLKMQHGLMRVKYGLVKYKLEGLILLLGPIFLRIVRGE